MIYLFGIGGLLVGVVVGWLTAAEWTMQDEEKATEKVALEQAQRRGFDGQEFSQ